MPPALLTVTLEDVGASGVLLLDTVALSVLPVTVLAVAVANTLLLLLVSLG